MAEHEHTEACETPETDSLLARLNDGGKPLTESQFRELRGRYFTVRHLIVKGCQHKLDQINEPTFRNCENCWYAFFNSHGELVKVTDEAFTEHGPAFIDKMRGRTYRKRFTQYMSTLATFKKEADALAAKEAQEKLNEQGSDIQGGRAVGKTDGQREDDSHVSAAGEVSEPTSTVNPDEPTYLRQ